MAKTLHSQFRGHGLISGQGAGSHMLQLREKRRKDPACHSLNIFPGEEIGYPLQYSCLENSHGQRSLGRYSPWSYKESDMTE